MGFLASLFNRPPKLNVYDLLYIYMRRGTPWGNAEPTWKMKNCFPNPGIYKHWDRAMTLGLIQPARAPDRLEYATIDELQPFLEKFGLKKRGSKSTLIQELMDAGKGTEVANSLPQVVGLTELGKTLLAQHDYIPYVVKRCKEIPGGFEKMFAARKRDAGPSKYEIILSSLSEETFFTDGCYDEKDKEYARNSRRYAKSVYRDFVKSVVADAKKDGIVIDIDRYLD